MMARLTLNDYMLVRRLDEMGTESAGVGAHGGGVLGSADRLREQADERRAEHRRAAGAALAAMRGRGERCARLRGWPESVRRRRRRRAGVEPASSLTANKCGEHSRKGSKAKKPSLSRRRNVEHVARPRPPSI
jgi:hypothetical protein